MKSSIACALALACVFTAGCDLLNQNSSSNGTSTPTSPTTPTTSITAFAGTWQSTTAATTLPVTGCGNLTYTVTPTGTNSANVVFAATCASNISVNGSGNGTLAGNVVTWSASGLVGQGGVNCPFSFNNNTATIDTTSNQVTIAYTGSVCGIPVSGSETVKK
ncbi:MAG TPA: hypothetical protein VH138_06180 [Vicinamibacterales bacterium]|jgi:hypothetical protein|nr:hypothetical protein [Vicinamibacterales bacterium]